jgi:hypothetical protein
MHFHTTFHKALTLLLCLAAAPATVTAQTDSISKPVVTGSLQTDILVPQEDDAIGTGSYDHSWLTNTYAEVGLQSKHIDAGLRLEYMKRPLPGFESDFNGAGLANIYAKMHTRGLEVTLGSIYEQFGSGFILRTYEERSLGVDNALMGARIVTEPVKGLRIKALTGYQRRYWEYNDAFVSGGDIELNIDRWIPALSNSGTYWTVGVSAVNKHERTEQIMADPTHRLNLPENVNAFDVRTRLQKGNVSLLAEYAQKTDDPSFDNGYIYRHGYVAMLSGSYSKRGMSLLVQAKRSDNMSLRSRRSTVGTSSTLSYLPAFTMAHTYCLPALNPYATQPLGEWAYQAEAAYTFKRNTALGGRYGTNVKLNFSHVRSIDKNIHDGNARGTDGYGSAFWRQGDETYYQDINIQVEKRVSKPLKLNLMYMNQIYNKTVVEGEGGTVRSNIFVAEAKYQLSKKVTLRGEAQYLSSKDDDGDWMFGLLELSVLPNWMFTVSDQYNVGLTNIHYYQGLVTYSRNSHRLQAGYVRTQAGYNCSGGVCRYVPASKGFTLSYTYNF